MTLVTQRRACYLAAAALWLALARAAARAEPAALQLLIVVTVLWAMTTRGLGSRRTGEASAYTVFNGGVALPGQLRAEQFDDEIRHRDVRQEAVDAAMVQSAVDRPGEVLLAPDRHERVLAELRREALTMRKRAGAAGAGAGQGRVLATGLPPGTPRRR